MSKAHVYKRDHINTDEIIPARYLNADDEAELAKRCLEDLDVEFVKKVQPGDVIKATLPYRRPTFNTTGNSSKGATAV